jgi:predicted acyl esterase
MHWTICAVMAVMAAEPPIDLGGVTEKHFMVPMRDGTKLSMYLYFPEGKGPWPVLYEQRYADLRGVTTRKAFARLAAAGYVVAAENFRGTHQSEGTWVGYRALGWGEQRDGYDTVEWLAAQPWSTGKIGTFGGSQAGFAQNFLAVTQPPHLVCQYMIDTGLSLFHEGYRIGGVTRPERFKAMEAVCREPEHNRRLIREWFAHPTYDDYWAAEDCTRHFEKMDVPCFTVGSWYDFMCVGSVESFIGRQHHGGKHSRGSQQLILGPWLHGGLKDNKIGELVYPENARFATEQHMIRWFDHYLKGKDNGVERDPVVRYYVMGALGEKDAPGNEWRTARDWPVPAHETAYFLQDGGRLTTTAPAQADGGTTFAADPTNPAKVPGRAFPGAADARPFEKHPDIRTFTTEVLTEPVEWTGKVRADLWVSSTARDTDFIVRISDVYPDGRSILLMDYVRRARYRDGYETEVLLEPGKVSRVAFDVGWVSQVFNKGHRIRVTVASTGAPFYEPNPNTGEPLTIEPPARTVVAKNTVHHDRRHASRVLAPVLPSEK